MCIINLSSTLISLIISGLCTFTKALKNAHCLEESKDFIFKILVQLGEEFPRSSGDSKLSKDMQGMIDTLQSTSDDSIFNMQLNTCKKTNALLELFSDLVFIFHIIEPSFVSSVSLRMVELTMKMGLTATAPLAFVYYGGILISSGHIIEGCRLGM